MIAFENIATNQAVKELNEQELLLLAKREENGRKVAQLKWQLALNKLQATLTHHTFVVEDNPPGYEKLLENSELWRAKHEKEARGEHVPMTHELLHLPAVTKRVMRMIHTLAHDEATRRGVIEAESSRTCARLELQLMVIVTTYEEGVPEDSTLAVERAARVTRDSVRSAEAEAFASLVEYAQVDGHYAAGRCEARRGYERELVEALVEDEAAGRTVGVARGETCARDVVRSDFMVGVRNLTSIWLFKTINAEVHARWAVEGDEQTVFDDLFEDSSGQAIVAHRNSERDALPPHGVVELEEAGWRRLLVSEGAAALRLLRTAYAAAAPWRGLLRSECTGRRGLEEQGALAASRMHCDLMDSVQWNLAAHRASTPAGSPWDAVEVVHQPPLVCAPCMCVEPATDTRVQSEGPEVLDALISESTHSLLDQWYCRSLPENAVSQPAVPPAIEHEDVSGPEGAAAAQKPDEVAPVVCRLRCDTRTCALDRLHRGHTLRDMRKRWPLRKRFTEWGTLQKRSIVKKTATVFLTTRIGRRGCSSTVCTPPTLPQTLLPYNVLGFFSWTSLSVTSSRDVPSGDSSATLRSCTQPSPPPPRTLVSLDSGDVLLRTCSITHVAGRAAARWGMSSQRATTWGSRSRRWKLITSIQATPPS